MTTEIDRSSWDGLADLRESLVPRLRRHCRDQSELEDVVQETLLRAARYRSQLRESGLLVPWSLRIAMNVLCDLRRLDQRGSAARQEGEEGSLGRLVEDEEEAAPYRMGRYVIEAEDAEDLLASVLPRLRTDDRSVLESFYGCDERSEVTARECGIPRRLVKMRVFRARQRLSRVLRHRLALRHAQPDAPLGYGAEGMEPKRLEVPA